MAVDGLNGGGLDLFAGLGWSWQYDAGVRLSYAAPGRGDIQGRAPPAGTNSFRYQYGKGDELERIIREADGNIAELTVGVEGRITHRDGIPFSYDAVGRRTEDDRFVYRRTWRGELATVTVKDSWPDGEVSPFAGHQIRYHYDALGRLLYRWHLAELPDGETDDALRPFIEKRAYVWEGEGLLAEVAYGDPDETQIRWRKTYVPGPSGIDDAVQVAVDVVDIPGSPYPGSRLYTYVRDELGTVIGVVAEDESMDPAQPSMPVRYLYSPYGNAHAELGPELRHVRFDNVVTSVETAAGPVEQTVADPALSAGGALRIRLSVPVTDGSLGAGVVVERLQVGGGWMAVDAAEAVVGRDALEPSELLVLLRSGWERAASYRVRLSTSLTDGAGRSFVVAGGESSHSLEWTVPTGTSEIPEPPVIFEQRFGLRYDSHLAAADTVGGRFPGGQTTLFQGLWTDPVTGLAYARARWYDSRNASWLSEDPMADVDSPNLYAFVAWQPNIATDPFGECWLGKCEDGSQSMGSIFWEGVKEGFGSSVDSIFDLLSHPLDIPQTLAEGVLTILFDGPHLLGEGIKALVMASPEQRASMLGNLAGGLAFDAVLAGVGTAANCVVKANKARKFADLATDATRVRRFVDGLSDAKLMAGKAHDTRGAVRHLDEIADMLPAGCIKAKCLTGDTLVANAEGLSPIREIKVGNRVITTEESYLGETAVDDATWKVVRVRMPEEANGSDVKLELLSSPEWIAAMGAKVGQEIWLELPEAGIAGFGV
ncbi:MAG: hypothetical protein GY856_55320, partial [bacterium]|nr:hypothetical protein [bacterium]